MMTGITRWSVAKYVSLAALIVILAYLGITMLKWPENNAAVLLPSLMAAGTLLGRLPIAPVTALTAGLVAAFHAVLPLVFRRAEIHVPMQVGYLGASLVLVVTAVALIRMQRG